MKALRLVRTEVPFRPSEVAESLGVSAATVRRWARFGALVAHQFRGSPAMWVYPSDLARFLKGRAS
jgi:excisionase family DNA binding protein